MVFLIRFVCVFAVMSIGAQVSNNKWSYIGPKANSYQFKGLFTSVWADETDLNNILAGSSGAGLFATYNALSDEPQWQNITDNLPYMNFGVSGIVVKKNSNNKTIYISTNTGGGIITHGFGNGIIYTENGGLSWSQIGPKGKEIYDFPLHGLVANNENQNEMIAFNHTDLFITRNSWKSFHSIKLPFHAEVEKAVEIAEVTFAPFEFGKIYVSTRTYLKNKAQLFVSNDYGNSWKDITPSDVACERIAIATVNNPKFKGKFYITSGNSDIVVKYFDGVNFSGPINKTPVKQRAGSSFWCLKLKVNDVDTSVIYLSLTETSKSNDGGRSFKNIGFYNGPNTHADVRDMILPKSTASGKYDRLILANDGGISMSKDFNGLSNVAFRNLNGIGLYANQFWGIDVLQSDSLFIVGGTQDNGGFFIKEHKENNNLFSCGDAYYGLVINDSIALMECNPPTFLIHNFRANGNAYVSIPDKYYEARRPLILKDSFVYVGYHDIWRARIKDLLANHYVFNNVSNLPIKADLKKGIQNREIKALAISKNNTALIGYANPNWDSEKNEGKLYYCKDLLSKKPEYIDVSILAGNRSISLCSWYQVESLVADDDHENTFYMIYKDVFTSSNSDVYKFIYYPDSNKAQLTPLTYNLKRVGFNKLKIDKNTSALYVATNDGIYYLNSKKDTVWRSLEFTPKTLVSDVVFNYYTNSIYASTFGRGIWGSQIPVLKNTFKRIRKNKKENEPVKVDGVLIITSGKRYQVNSKLIVTIGSKIELKRNSKLIIQSKRKVVDENNKVVDIEPSIIKHKKAQIIYLNEK